MKDKKPLILINPPPRNRCCEFCERKIEDVPGKKLFKNFREFMGWISSSWECSDCLENPLEEKKGEIY